VKIGIYDPYLDTLGGGEKYMLTAASCLSKDHEVSIFWDDKTIIDKVKERYNLDISSTSIVPNIFSSKSLITRVFQTQKYDAIFYLSDGSIPFVGSKKLFLHFQFPIEWVQPTFLTKIKLARIRKVICNSNFTKNYIDQKLNISSLVIYPPIDIGHKIKNKKNIILTVGRIQKNSDGKLTKKQEVMIATFKKMVDEGLNGWNLYVVGGVLRDDSLISELKTISEGYPIKILANINAEELESLYEEAKIYWHATGFGEDIETHPERAEHFGMATVEAMAHGVIPVVINMGGQREIVEDEKNGFLWDDEKELIEKTTLLIKSPIVIEKLRKNALLTAKDFSRNKFCEEINKLFT